MCKKNIFFSVFT